jgi:uncharacterized phage protein (TIGR01671 family)
MATILRRDILDYPDGGLNGQGGNYSNAHITKDDYIIMQFTGLKDKNGLEIYEGDILNFTYWWFDGNQAETNLVGVVVYIGSEASYGLAHIRNKEWIRHIGGEPGDEDTQSFSGWQFTSDDMEVIGNVYENPELLAA